jgi:hypothetical protein
MSRKNRPSAVDRPAIEDAVVSAPVETVVVEPVIIDKPLEQTAVETATEAAATAQVEHQGDRIALVPVEAVRADTAEAAMDNVAQQVRRNIYGLAEPELPEPAMTFVSRHENRAEPSSAEMINDTEVDRKERLFFERETEYLAKYPRTAELIRKCESRSLGRVPTLRITAKKDGFRRAGMVHPTTPVEYSAFNFNPDQLEQLLTEPNLVVEVI